MFRTTVVAVMNHSCDRATASEVIKKNKHHTRHTYIKMKTVKCDSIQNKRTTSSVRFVESIKFNRSCRKFTHAQQINTELNKKRRSKKKTHHLREWHSWPDRWNCHLTTLGNAAAQCWTWNDRTENFPSTETVVGVCWVTNRSSIKNHELNNYDSFSVKTIITY